MSVASDIQIAQWAYQTGWPLEEIPWLVGESHGESGGDPSRLQIGFGSYLGGVRQGGVGLLQVDVFQHPQYGVEWLKDPLNNLRASLEIWKAQGRGAWYGANLNPPTLAQVKDWIAGLPNPSTAAADAAAGALQSGIAGAGSAVGAALTAVPTQIGHGLVLFGAAAGHNLITFAETQAVAIFVALVVVLVVFLA